MTKGPSIYDVHTERGQAQVDTERGSGPCGRPHWKFRNLRFTCENL